jgi:fructose-1,6-bisphosphatase/inositol monophosphatase family enzyme
VLDPLDGTSAYLSGQRQFGVQVALLNGAQVVAGWIHCPAQGWTGYAWEGLTQPVLTGVSEAAPSVSAQLHELTAVIASGDFDRGHREIVARTARHLAASRGTVSCAVDYLELVAGLVDVLVYRRTLIWDHAPGIYLARRVGAQTIGFDRRPYRSANPNGGALVARTSILTRFQEAFLPAG